MNYLIEFTPELKAKVKQRYGDGTWGKDRIGFYHHSNIPEDFILKPFIKLQGFWFRSDIISGRGKHNFHYMNSTFCGTDNVILAKERFNGGVILKPDTPFEVIEAICKYEDAAYKFNHTDWGDKEQDTPIRLNNWETTHKELFDIVKPWLAEDQSIDSIIQQMKTI